MPSLLPGYEYDIFISYRQNDNRSGWVKEFVKALEEELSATIKEPVSVYFDSNPHDGLLETHNVDKSLERKLKSLIFIPIVSQTYCDTKSFAWQQEFCAFNKLAKEDQFGRDVKLVNGNIASRILPVKIHTLDIDDQKVLEREMGTVLRAVEFIYKEPGVNRPLSPDDDYTENINKTKYRNQVNKVANAVKEILAGLRSFGQPDSPYATAIEVSADRPTMLEKSIIVLPFENMSSDNENEYFSDGLTEEIIADLSNMRELSVISRSSAMTFKGTGKKSNEICAEVNVRYLLEGSVRKDGNNLRITAQLIDGVSDVHIWAEKYSGTMDSIFEFQEKLSRSIVSALKLHLTPAEYHKLSVRPVSDTRAYECYIRARQEMWKLTGNGLNTAVVQLERGLELGGKNATIYATLATTYFFFHHFGLDVREEMLTKANENSTLSLELDPNCAQGMAIKGMVQFKFGKLQEAVRTFKEALTVDPASVDALLWISISYCLAGKTEQARPYSEKLLQIDPLTVISKALQGWIEYYAGNLRAAIPLYDRWLKLDPDGPFTRWCCGAAYSYVDVDRSCEIFDSIIRDMPQLVFSKHALFMKAALKGNKAVALQYATPQLKEEVLTLDYLRIQMAMGFALIGEKEEAVWWLQKSLDGGFINYPLWVEDPFLKRLEGYPPYTALMAEMKVRWENFESFPKTASGSSPSANTKGAQSLSPSPTNSPKKSLRRAAVIGLAGLALLISAYFLYTSFTSPRLDQSIAVLPFTDMSPGHDQEYLGDGIAEDIITALSRIKDLKVIGRTSSFQFKGEKVDLREIGSKLNVSTVLEGSVMKSDNKIRITAQLINVNDGSHIWSERYDKSIDDIFSIQDEISRMIAAKMTVTILRNGSEDVQKPTENIEAYENVLYGMQLMNRGFVNAKAAIPFFEKAIELDSTYVTAYEQLAFAHFFSPFSDDISPAEQADKIKRLVQAIFKLDANSYTAHNILFNVYWNYEWDWGKAEEQYNFSKAIVDRPTIGHALYRYCVYNDFKSCEAEFLKVIDLNPLDKDALRLLGGIYERNRQPDKALEMLNRCIQIDPTYGDAYVVLAYVYLTTKEYKQAEEAFKKAANLSPQGLDVSGYITLLMKLGKEQEAMALFNSRKSESIPAEWHAQRCFAIGKTAEGFEWLEKAFDSRNPIAAQIRLVSGYDHLLNDPRFIAIIKKMNLPK